MSTRYLRLYIETKYHKTSASDIIRQVGLYKEYLPPQSSFRWCVLTFFDLSDLEQTELVNAKINWIRMGSRFDDWWTQQ